MTQLSVDMILHKEAGEKGAPDYYAINIALGELGIGQFNTLTEHVIDTLTRMLGDDAEVLATGMMSDKKQILIPATLLDRLSTEQKQELLQPVVDVLGVVRANQAVIKEAIADHKAAGGNANFYNQETKDGTSNYVLMYTTSKHTDGGLVSKGQIAALADTINALAGANVCVYDAMANNRFWAGSITIHQNDFANLMATHREELQQALAHPEALQAKKNNFLNDILSGGPGSGGRKGWSMFH